MKWGPGFFYDRLLGVVLPQNLPMILLEVLWLRVSIEDSRPTYGSVEQGRLSVDQRLVGEQLAVMREGGGHVI